MQPKLTGTDMTLPATTRRLTFEYWSDPLCIWAYVAQARLDALLACHGDALDIRYHVVPVFGSVPWRFREGGWAKGGVAGRVAATKAIAARFGHPHITGAAWKDDCPPSSWSPGMAIKAVFALEEQGVVAPGQGAAYQWALRRAFFEDNRNIALREVQLELVTALGIETDPFVGLLNDGTALALLCEDNQLRHASSIQGSPTYVFDGGRARLYGNFNERVLKSTVDALLTDLVGGASAC